jgi:hypothetical protein
MKKLVVLLVIISFVAVSCNNTGKGQTWHPRSGKPMKRGKNNK